MFPQVACVDFLVMRGETLNTKCAFPADCINIAIQLKLTIHNKIQNEVPERVCARAPVSATGHRHDQDLPPNLRKST